MISRWVLMALGALSLCACGVRESAPRVRTLIDENIVLTREQKNDIARRVIEVDEGSIVVAIVDERLTDVQLNLAWAADGEVPPVVQVESNLAGAGHEIAMIAAPGDARVVITVAGPQSSVAPGSVALRVRVFSAAARKDPALAPLLEGYEAWTTATNASFRADAVRKIALPQLDRAISSFERPGADPALAAQARRVKANLLYLNRIDWRAARAGAASAEKAFAALPQPDPLNAARARFLEAQALIEIGSERTAVDPDPAAANALARDILVELHAPESVLPTIERARVIQALGNFSMRVEKMADSYRYLEEARTIFEKAGYVAGEIEARADVGAGLVEEGRFTDGAIAYDAVLPRIDKIVNPHARVYHLLNAARAMSVSGRTDDSAELLLVALAQSREYQNRLLEARALHGLGHFYQYSSDLLQARVYLTEVVKVMSSEPDTMEYVWALASAGVVARLDGDYEAALEMHHEAVRRSSNGIGDVRTWNEVGLDYYAARNYPAAEDAYRKALAVKLDDPGHHAYTDIKRNLALVLIENGNGSPARLAEADKLLADALQVCLKVRDVPRQVNNHRVTGELRIAQGRHAEARREFERTFELARELREQSANSDARAATSAQEQAAFRGYLDLLLKNVAGRGPAAPRRASAEEERALRNLEQARDAAMGAMQTAPLDAETNARVDALLAQMAQKSLQISAMPRRDLSAQEKARFAAVQLEMSNLHAEVDRLRTAAARKAPGSRSPARVERAWRKLAPGVVQLSYGLGTKFVYAWTRTPSGTFITVLAQPPAELERELIALDALDRQAAPDKVEQALERVSTVLLPEGLLPGGASTIEIVAEGRIAGLPFSGLRSPTDPARRFVETHTITMVSSMFDVEAAPRVQQARPFRFVALASGHGTLRAAAAADPTPKLQAATKEVRVVADLFEAREPGARIKLLLGSEGNAAALRGIWGSGVDVVHFATHALADLRQPLASLLVMPATNDQGDATYLTAGQVREWRGDADLVFLSTCESAIGPPRFAAGMPGLQSAFLRAGARGVIATLWPIEDLLAQQFSADFYRRFTADMTAVQALKETQRAWLLPDPTLSDVDQRRRRITALAHAYYAR